MVDVAGSIELVPAPRTPSGTAPERLVRSYRLGDDLVVRLSGVPDGQVVPEPRRKLFAPVAGSSWARAALPLLRDAG